jgi:hypothetical protein
MAAVTNATTTMEIPEMILMAFRLFLEKMYRRAMKKDVFTCCEYRHPA